MADNVVFSTTHCWNINKSHKGDFLCSPCMSRRYYDIYSRSTSARLAGRRPFQISSYPSFPVHVRHVARMRGTRDFRTAMTNYISVSAYHSGSYTCRVCRIRHNNDAPYDSSDTWWRWGKLRPANVSYLPLS